MTKIPGAQPSAPTPQRRSTDPQAVVARLVQWYESLSPAQLTQLPACYAANAHFKDPFNDVQGVAQIHSIFAHMFATLDHPRFRVTHQMVQGQQAFLAWEFHFAMRRWRAGQMQCIQGVSLLSINAEGLVQEHRDYWDTAEELYAKLPVLQVLMRWLRKAGAAPQPRSTHAMED